jgi:hypothetical protein
MQSKPRTLLCLQQRSMFKSIVMILSARWPMTWKEVLPRRSKDESTITRKNRKDMPFSYLPVALHLVTREHFWSYIVCMCYLALK